MIYLKNYTYIFIEQSRKFIRLVQRLGNKNIYKIQRDCAEELKRNNTQSKILN